MTPVNQFAQYLLRLDPQRNPARLALYNFLKHVLDPEMALSPVVMQTFYARALQFPYWQSEARMLNDTTKADLTAFLRHSVAGTQVTGWENIRHPESLQIVPIKIFQDMRDLIEDEHASRPKSGDRLSIVKFSDDQTLLVRLMESGELEVKVYPNTALVWGSRLRLMAPVTQLHYGIDMELKAHVRQILDGNLHTTHCFSVDEDGVHGLISRGHTFQKYETFIRAKLTDTRDLFTSLKRLERHYINPQSDPLYQELVTRMERANRLLNHPSPENLEAVERALNKGRLYLKTIFPNDRLLGLLVTHLDHGISQSRHQTQ